MHELTVVSIIHSMHVKCDHELLSTTTMTPEQWQYIFTIIDNNSTVYLKVTIFSGYLI